jgi:hypothetical protein
VARSQDREEGTGKWMKMCDKELHNLYPSADIIREYKLKRIK